jgi:putative DNA primase/helicase
MTTSFEHAQHYHDQYGFSLTPVRHKTKKPYLDGWQRGIDPATYAEHFNGHEQNIGVILGTRSGNLIDVDCDCAETMALAAIFLPPTGMIFGRASKPRSHYLYRCDTSTPVKPYDDPVAKGRLVELRGDGGQTVLPGSVHESGEAVRFDDEGDPATVPLADLQRAVSKVAAASLLARYWRLSEGVRSNLAMALGGGLLRAGWSVEETEEFIKAVATAAGDDEVDQRVGTVKRTDARIKASGHATGFPALAEAFGANGNAIVTKVCNWLGIVARQDEPPLGQIHHTDVGNGKRLVIRHGEDIRYCHGLGWLVWDGTRWKEDKGGAIVRKAKDTITGMFETVVELRNGGNPDAATRLANHATRSEQAQRVAAMIEMAKSELGVEIEIDDLDAEPLLLNCRNGTLDLRAGRLRPHDRADLITKRIEVDYDSAAECPQWHRFLKLAMDDDDEMIAFLQRAVGYSLTGLPADRIFFLLWGRGNNGKSVFLETISKVLGSDYAGKVNTDALMRRHASGIPNDVAELRGKRFVYASEGNEGQQLDEGRIKDITGAETISARFMRGEWFRFVPIFKLWFGTNHRPVVKDDTDGIWDRMRLIPFTVRIPDKLKPEERVERSAVMDSLLAESAGILAWAVEGCLAWQQEKILSSPDKVKHATAGYRLEMDSIGDFLAEKCVFAPDATVSLSDLYQKYKWWCQGSGERYLGKIEFNKRVEGRNGAYHKRAARNVDTWFGIGLLDDGGDDMSSAFMEMTRNQPVG